MRTQKFRLPLQPTLEPLLTPVRRVEAAVVAKPTAPPPARPKAPAKALQVDDDPDTISFVIATEAVMDGLFGSIQLLCGKDNLDLTRLNNGLVAFAADHNAERLIGQVTSITAVNKVVYGQARFISTPFADSIRSEIRQKARLGVSPGFIILDYTVDPDFNMVVSRYSIFEVSSTSQRLRPSASRPCEPGRRGRYQP